MLNNIEHFYFKENSAINFFSTKKKNIEQKLIFTSIISDIQLLRIMIDYFNLYHRKKKFPSPNLHYLRKILFTKIVAVFKEISHKEHFPH